MSDEQTKPPTLPESLVTSIDRPVSAEPQNIKKSPKFISASDLPEIIRILVGADKITPDEAVRRLNNMVAKGILVICPLFGTKRKS